VSIDPDGRELGVTIQGGRDFLRLAVGVYLVDRTVPRGSLGWKRDLALEVPVGDTAAWERRAPAVEALLDFLTGDTWTLGFRAHAGSPITRAQAQRRSDHSIVSLFSGGMDSFAGAVGAVRDADARPLLVGHWNWSATRSSQDAALGALEALTGVEVPFTPVRLSRGAFGADGTRSGAEASSRSRSLVFLAIAAAAATGTRATTVQVPENGWVSLNVPLDGSRRGSLTTRTTHPGLLAELSGLTADLGIGVTFENPWALATKGELVQQVADWFGAGAASDAFKATGSCAKSGMRFYGIPPATHCGVCYACLVRRGAFIAAAVADQTPYAEALLHGQDRDRFMLNRRRDLVAIAAAGRQAGHFGIEDILALDLPDSFDPDAALALANRGLDEVRLVDIR
jgi:hypothetical protein